MSSLPRAPGPWSDRAAVTLAWVGWRWGASGSGRGGAGHPAQRSCTAGLISRLSSQPSESTGVRETDYDLQPAQWAASEPRGGAVEVRFHTNDAIRRRQFLQAPYTARPIASPAAAPRPPTITTATSPSLPLPFPSPPPLLALCRAVHRLRMRWWWRFQEESLRTLGVDTRLRRKASYSRGPIPPPPAPLP